MITTCFEMVCIDGLAKVNGDGKKHRSVPEVFLAASPARGFGLRPKMCRPSANTENFLRTREKPLVPRVENTSGLRVISISHQQFSVLITVIASMTNTAAFLVSIHCKSLGQILWSPDHSLREFPSFLASLRRIKKKVQGMC